MELHKRKQGSYCWMAPWVVGAAIVSQWLQWLDSLSFCIKRKEYLFQINNLNWILCGQ
jgi:hypothetical protein